MSIVSIPRHSPFMQVMALGAILLPLIPAVLSQPGTIALSSIDDSNAKAVFTPSVCNHGHTVVADRLPEGCNQAWFITSDESSTYDGTWHATGAPDARVSLPFTGTAISWFSPPVSQARGTADVFIDGTHISRVQLSPNNTGPTSPVWSSTSDLSPDHVHNLTILVLGDGIVTVDYFTIIQSQSGTMTSADPAARSAPSTIPSEVASADLQSDAASTKDGSSGAVISAASIGAVALVVIACGGCFFLGKRRKSPGFHMPTVLVDIESALERPDPPSPTTIRVWRDSVRRSTQPEAQGEPNRDSVQYPPSGAYNSRPPSYRSGKDVLDSESSQSHEGHWQ